MTTEKTPADEADIVRIMLDRVSAAVPSIEPAALAAIEAEIREQFGGQRLRIPKRRKQLTDEQRQQILAAALASDPATSNEALAQEAGVSRATWYRMIKARAGEKRNFAK